MKLLLAFLLLTGSAVGAQWDSVQSISAGQTIEVTTKDGMRTHAALESSTSSGVVVREKTGEHTISRSDIRRVRIADPARRIRSGIIWVAVGAASGAVVGELVCVSCPNEGHGYKYVGPGLAIGAAVGALGFLRSPYRTVYESH